MPLSLHTERAGGVVVVKCAGRLVEGPESAALEREVETRLGESAYIVVDVGAVDFIDSSGLGLLVRLLNRARIAGAELRISSATSHIREILKVTRLDTILTPYASVEEAIASSYEHARSAGRPDELATDVLVVASSHDVLAYVREILRQAGYGVLSSDNLPDAVMLLRATNPKAVVISGDLRAVRSTAGEVFNQHAGQGRVVELPADFSHREAGEAGMAVLERVRAVIGAS